MKKFFILFVSLFILINSQQYSFCEIPSQSSIDPNFQSLSLLALLFTFSFLGLLYAIGVVSDSSSIKAFVKTEYFEAVKSAILLVGILSIISFLNSIMLPLTGEQDLINGACHKALELKGDPTSGGVEKIMQDIFNYAFELGLLAPFSITFGIGIGVGGISIDNVISGSFLPSSMIEWAYPPTKFTLINYIINDPVYGIENSFLTAIGRLIILSLTPVFVYQFLLPVGLFLRSFPVLRKVGGTFIALSIVLLVIYPSLVLFFDYPFMKKVIDAVAPVLSTSESNFQLEFTVFGIKINLSKIMETFLYALTILYPGALVGTLALDYLSMIVIPSIISLYLPLNYFLSALAVNLAQMVIIFIDLLVIYTMLLDLTNIIGGKFTIAGREIRGFGFLKV